MSYGFVGRGRGRGLGIGGGWGRGNPYPHCRWYPNLPRGWWRMPPEYWQGLGLEIPTQTYPLGPWLPSSTASQSSVPILENQIKVLEAQIEELRKTIARLQESSD